MVQPRSILAPASVLLAILSGTCSRSPGASDETITTHVERECAAYFACGCEQLPWPDLETCAAERGAELRERNAAAEARDLFWDQACADARVATIEGSCAAADSRDTCVGRHCELFTGELSEGASCDSEGRHEGALAGCGAGFACRSGRCVAVCGTLGEGDPCVLGDAEHLAGTDCGEALVCAYLDADAACVKASDGGAAGHPCSITGPGCHADLYCPQSQGMCTPRPGAGEPCAQENAEDNVGVCDGESFCDPGPFQCIARRPDGQPCTDTVHCSSGACDGGTCVPPPATVGAQCNYSVPCAPPLQCDHSSSSCEYAEWHACSRTLLP